MGNKKAFRVNPRTVAFFIGLFICLLSVVLIMNVGYPARGVALPFFYLFGIGSYILYLLLYAVGLSFLFRGKGIKFKFNLRFLGIVLLFLSLLGLLTLIICKSDGLGKDFYKQYNDLLFAKAQEGEEATFADNGGYWNTPFINLFSKYHFAGGLVGYAIAGGLKGTIGQAGAYAIVIVILLLSLVLIFLKQIKQGINHLKTKLSENKKEKSASTIKPKESEPSRALYANNQAPSFEERRVISNYSEKQMIRSASRLDERESQIIRSNPPGSVNTMTRASLNNAQGVNPHDEPISTYGAASAFVPARFVMRGSIDSKETIVESQHIDVMEESVKPETVLLESNKEVTKNEQLTLDFNAKPEFNEELLTAKPEFLEDEKPAIQPQIEIKPAVIEKPIKKKVKWIPPSVALLEDMQTDESIDKNNAVAQERMEMINSIFQNFGIGAKCVDYVVGPSVTNFKIEYENNVTVRSVNNLLQDISVRLGGVAARFESVVEGSHYSGIEVSNAVITSVSFKEVYENLPEAKKKPLAVGFGKNIEGKIISADFTEFPHVLVAGTTGSGKSVFIHSIICTLIMRNSPDDLKLVLIDPKQVEMASYRDIPHLLCPVITDVKKAKGIMDKLVQEMNDRYRLFEDNIVRSVTEFNEIAAEKGLEKLPYIVVVIDEYADLVQVCKEISGPVVSIAQKARAAGIHMLISTQRPSTDVITGVIKGNLPTRVALSVSSQVDSVTVLGEGGAEKLLGRGDMLVSSPLVSRIGPVRLQGCYIKSKEMRYIINYLKEHYQVEYDPKFLNLEEEATKEGEDFVNSPAFNYDNEDNEEAKYKSVKEWVMSNKYMSLSRIQRECSVGFNRAGRFFKRLQNEGVVAMEPDGNKGCPVLTNDDFYDDDNVVTSEELTRN